MDTCFFLRVASCNIMRINLKFGIEFPTLAVAGVFSGMSGWLDNLQQIEAEKQCNVMSFLLGMLWNLPLSSSGKKLKGQRRSVTTAECEAASCWPCAT